MSAQAKRVLAAWIKTYIPKDTPFGELKALAKAAQISPATIQKIRQRESVGAETILSILLAKGVLEEDLTGLTQKGDVKYSKSLSEWNRLGNSLSEHQREQILKLVSFLLSDWKLK